MVVMRRCLGVLMAASTASLPARAECPPPRVLLERFVYAHCEPCWRATPPTPSGARGTPFVLDWIVPSDQGARTSISHAALAEAAPRAARAGNLRSDEVLTQSTPLPQRSALRLKVEDGPASNGYIALKLDASYHSTRALPQGLAGYLALVERLNAGDDGSPVARQVVRAVIGPLPLAGLAPGHSVDHLRAVRVPENVDAARLSSVGWLETPAGRMLAIAASRADAQCK
jgi:hypothetical protein